MNEGSYPAMKGDPTTLGDMLGEERGEVTGTRMLSVDGPDTKVEVSFQAGERITEVIAYNYYAQPCRDVGDGAALVGAARRQERVRRILSHRGGQSDAG